MVDAVAVHKKSSSHQAASVCLEPAYASPCDQLDAATDVLWPVSTVHRCFGTFNTPPHAGGALGACAEGPVTASGNGVWPWPPVPAKPVVSLRYAPAHGGQWARRQWRSFFRRESRSARPTKKNKIEVHPLIIRLSNPAWGGAGVPHSLPRAPTKNPG